MADATTTSFPRRAAQVLLLALIAMLFGVGLAPQLQQIASADTAEPAVDDVISEINARRAELGLTPLAPLRSLSSSAALSVKGLVDWDDLAEDGIGEAFTYGTTVSAAVDAALTTPHRRALLLSDDITHIGIGTDLALDLATGAPEVHYIIHVATAADGVA